MSTICIGQVCEFMAGGVHRLCELLGREHAGSMSTGNNANLPANLPAGAQCLSTLLTM